MIKTLRYAFVAALMMVAGAVNAQTTKAATTEKITIEFYDYYKDFEKQGEKKMLFICLKLWISKVLKLPLTNLQVVQHLM